MLLTLKSVQWRDFSLKNRLGRLQVLWVLLIGLGECLPFDVPT